MKNPEFTPSNGTTVNASGGSSINNQHGGVRQSFNRFNLSNKVALTARYADITPIEVIHAIPRDNVPFGNFHELRSLPFQSPCLSKLRQYKTYFQVPMSAILPRTWDLIYTNPVSGDDVPDDAICVIDGAHVTALIENLVHFVNSVDYGDDEAGNLAIQAIFLLESILSYGGITAYLGCPMSSAWGFRSINDYHSIDNFIELEFVPTLKDALTLGTFERTHYLLDQVRYNGLKFSLIPDTLVDFFRDLEVLAVGSERETILPPFNYDSLLAYQLGCAEFFSNEFIDAVFNADLYRKNAESFLHQIFEPRFFSYNGTQIQYDVFSGHNFNRVIDFLESPTDLESVAAALNYLKLIFNFRQSLRASDYFTSVKSRPLALGDVTSPVVAGGVSAVDITRNIQAQRFLNVVNKVGRKFSSYMRGIMGSNVPPDRHEPHFLAQSMNVISGMEVEQTSPDSGSNVLGQQVLVLKSSGGQFEYEAEFDTSSVIIGVLHYDIDRLYADSMEKFFIHENRYDMFNPFMQYTGDQAIAMCERYYGTDRDHKFDPYGYQVKYCEYKQRFNKSLGAFAAGTLPSWSFTDHAQATEYETMFNINSDNIRNQNYEFDRFFKSLSYSGLASNFHFILFSINDLKPGRAIEAKSNIL